MDWRWSRGGGGYLAAALCAACGGAAPPPAEAAPATSLAPVSDTPPASAPVDTGKACATAQGRCGGGACSVTIKNGCDSSVRCELDVLAQCEAQSGSAEATGKGRDSFAPGASGDLGANATCADGRVTRTEVSKLVCR